MLCRELFEARAIIDGKPITLFQNPLPGMLMFFIQGTRRGIARGALIGEDVYYFDACVATHEDVQEYFGVPVEDNGFDVAEINEGDHFIFACQEHALNMLLKNPNVVRSINDPRISIAREDGTEEKVLDKIGRGGNLL